MVLSYRVRRLRKYGGWAYLLLLPLDVLLGMARNAVSDTTIPSCVPVGEGLYLPHPNGIIVNHQTRIGSDVSIFQQVTIGEWHGKAPVIGNGCSLFAGAKIFGGISIGSDSKVGANVVLNNDLPNNASASVGEPVIRIRKSN